MRTVDRVQSDSCDHEQRPPRPSAFSRRTSHCLRSAFAALVLTAAWSTQAQSVFVKGNTSPIVTDPLFAQDSAPWFEAVADLVSGDIGAAVDFTGGGLPNLNAQAGMTLLGFTNTGPSFSSTFSVHVTGDPILTYDLDASVPSATLGTQVISTLSGAIGVGVNQFVAREEHRLTHTPSGFSNTLLPPITAGGGTVTVNQANFLGLDLDLSFPFTLATGQTLSVSFSISTSAFGGTADRALADFCCSAHLSLELPVGASVVNNTGQTLSWVTVVPEVPEPSVTWLLLAGLAPMVYRARRLSSYSPR